HDVYGGDYRITGDDGHS
nr:RecName: Full=Cystathionine beta lyase; AltName: Full=Cysteine-S-conjugate beta-lyase [Papiliotrema laurentii]